MKFSLLIALSCCALATANILPIYKESPLADLVEVEEAPAEVVDVPISRASSCVITVKTQKVEPQPLYLVPNGGFWDVDGKGQMTVAAGGKMEFYCPAKLTSPFSEVSVTAECVGGTTFKVGSTEYDFMDFKCASWPSFTARRVGAACESGVTYESGFNLGTRGFLSTSTICFNEQTEATRYVHHVLVPGSDYYQTSIPRTTFITAGFFGGKNVDNLYTQKTQQETISRELGYDASKYFDTSTIFLARGHLAAKADYIMGTTQRGTFLFLNAGPQWQSFNAGNWQRVEDGVRTMVSKRQIKLDCYTGTYGVTTLPNAAGVETALYLYDSPLQIPVPKIYFRILYEASTKKAIVLVGVNNPHLTVEQIKKNYTFCTDISDKVSYVNWDKENIVKGYSYACEYSDFRKTVKNTPELSVSGIFE